MTFAADYRSVPVLLVMVLIVLIAGVGRCASPAEPGTEESKVTPTAKPAAPTQSDAHGMAADKVAALADDPDRARRMQWWTDARFGMFLCWSPAAVKGLGDDGWNIAWNRMTWDEYDKMARQFRPDKFDAKRIAKQIKSSGVGYVVFTTKHHAGFSMWDSKATDFDLKDYYGQDLLKPLVEALRAEGIRVGLYFSGWDWSRESYRGVPKEAPELNRGRGGVSVEEGNPKWPDFIQFYLSQARELTHNYGKVDILWIDAWRKHNPEKWHSAEMKAIAREGNPDIIFNDRTGDTEGADFITPENHVPKDDPGRPWETCYRANGGWFYTKSAYRPTPELVHMLIECVGKNGNLLLNFPLDPEGQFDAEGVAKMKEIGTWLDANGASIRGCGSAGLRATPWGNATAKDGRLYLQLFADRVDPARPIVIEGLATPVTSAKILATGQKVTVERNGKDVLVRLPAGLKLDPSSTVVDLSLDGELTVARDRFITDWTVLDAMSPKLANFRKEIGPEGRIDTTTPFVIGETRFAWKPVQANAAGYVDLSSQDRQSRGTTFATVDVISPADVSATLLFSSSSHAAVYLNGSQVLTSRGLGREETEVRPDDESAVISLPAGRSTLVLKLYDGVEPFGFYAHITGVQGLRYVPTESMAFVGSEPASWSNAPVVIEVEDARLQRGTDRTNCKFASKGFIARFRPQAKPETGGVVAEIDVPRDLSDAWAMVRYGHIDDTAVAIQVDDGKPVTVELPNTKGWRRYQMAMAKFGPLTKGKHTVRVYATKDTGAFHVDAVVFAEGELLGTSLRVPRP